MAERFPRREPLAKAAQHQTSQFSSLDYRRAVGLQELSPVVLPVPRTKKVVALLPSRRGARSSPSLQDSFSDRVRSSPIASGHFLDLQSPAYELAEYPHEQTPENGAIGHAYSLPRSLAEKSNFKARSGWNSIRPHLISSKLGAGEGSFGANEIHQSTSAARIHSGSPQNQTLNDSSLSSGAAEVPLRRLSLGFNSLHEPQASRDGDIQATKSHVVSNSIVCSYLDATNEFSDIPMIEGTLRIHNATATSQTNAALLQWKDIFNRIEVRLFSIKALRRGFSDVSVIPDIKTSFFDLRKFGDLYPRRLISITGLGAASNSASGQASVNSERSFCLIFSSDQSCLDALETITSLTLTKWVDAQDLSKKYSKLSTKGANVNERHIQGNLRTNLKTDYSHEDASVHRPDAVASRTRRTTTVVGDPQDLSNLQGNHLDSAKRHHIGVTDVAQSKAAANAQETETPENGLIWFFRFVKNFYQRAMTNPKKVIFSLSNSHFWICVVLGCSVYSLLARDIWTIAKGPRSGDPLLYGLLMVCFVVFCMQVFANFVVDRSHYQFGYKFWVDILVILTTIFDVVYSATTSYDLGCASVGLRANQCLVYFVKAQQFARIHMKAKNDEDLVRSMVDLQNSRIAADRFLQQKYPMGCTEQNLPYLEVLEVLEQHHMTLSQKIIKIFNQRVTITVLVLIFIFQFGKVFVAVSDFPNVFQLSSILMLTDLTPNRDINVMPAVMIMGNTLDLYPNTLSLCIEGVCPVGINDPEPSDWRSSNLKRSQLGDSKNYLWLVSDIESDVTLSIFNMVSLFGIPILIVWANVAFNRDIDRLVKNPLQKLTERINEFAANPSTKMDDLMSENDARKTKEETYYIQRQLCHLLKALQSSCGPVGNYFLSENLTKNEFSLAMQGKKVRIVSASVDIRNFTELSECLDLDIFLYINKICGHLHSFVALSAGCCFRNSGDQFSCAWRCSDKTEDVKALAERQAKEGETKSKKESKTTNAFDKALSAMIKTLNSCHFDQELREKALYCEPLTNLLPNFELKLCFGFHYGSAIEGIIGSNYRFETCFASMNSDFHATLQRGCTYYRVNSLFSDKFVQSLSSLTRNSFRLLDFVQVPGLREPLGIYTFDWVPKDPSQYAHVKSIKQFFDLNPSKYSIDDLSEYRKAIDAYVEGKWTSAIEQFKSLLETKFIGDGPCKKMIEFMQMFGSTPPDDWKGCSEVEMLEGIKDIRDIYNLSY